MNVSRAQVIKLKAELWPAACRAQGWNVKDRAFHMAWLSTCLGREISSSIEIEHKHEFDKVVRDLNTLADNFAAAMEQDHEAAARRTMDTVRDVLKCIALYHAAPRAIARELIRDKVCKGRLRRRDAIIPEIEDLSTAPRFITIDGVPQERPSELEQLLFTLTRILNGKTGLRNQAGDTLHQMRIKAAVPCTCAACAKAKAMGCRYDQNFELIPITENHVVAATEMVPEPVLEYTEAEAQPW